MNSTRNEKIIVEKAIKLIASGKRTVVCDALVDQTLDFDPLFGGYTTKLRYCDFYGMDVPFWPDLYYNYPKYAAGVRLGYEESRDVRLMCLMLFLYAEGEL